MEYSPEKIIKAVMLTAIGLLLAIFIRWFIPVFIYGIASTPESQMCRFDKQTKEDNFRKIISTIDVDNPDPGAITFRFTDGSKYVRARGFFSQQLDSIAIGDTLNKPIGALYLEALGQNKRVRVSLKYGCGTQ
jgi:hypothetical protein